MRSKLKGLLRRHFLALCADAGWTAILASGARQSANGSQRGYRPVGRNQAARGIEVRVHSKRSTSDCKGNHGSDGHKFLWRRIRLRRTIFGDQLFRKFAFWPLSWGLFCRALGECSVTWQVVRNNKLEYLYLQTIPRKLAASGFAVSPSSHIHGPLVQQVSLWN